MPASSTSERSPDGSSIPVSIEDIVSQSVETLRPRLLAWRSVVASEVTASEVSGLGGGQTFILTIAGAAADPLGVLHIHDEYFVEDADTTFFDRVQGAQSEFAEAGVSPRRLLDDSSSTWFIEEWVGRSVAYETITTELVEDVARLVARIHAIDTAWYDDIRERQRERHPVLRAAPDASHIWFYAAMRQHFFEGVSDEKLLDWIATGPAPVSAAGSRLVTVHGDVHQGNLARSKRGLRLIDLEAAGVNYAVHDIAYCFGTTCRTDNLKDAFARAYLTACDLPATTQDVYELRLDAERCKMATNHFDMNGVVRLPSSAENDAGVGPLYPELVALADRTLVDAELGAVAVRDGFDACAPVIAAARRHGVPMPDTAVLILAEQAGPSWRTNFTINWDGTIQSSWQRYRALVLGLVDGEIVLTNCLSASRLRLRMVPGGIPVTGLRAPSAAPVELRLTENQEGRALVLSDTVGEGWWNPLGSVHVGRRQDAIAVHAEPDGVIRLADTPMQAFDCANGHTSPGTSVQLFHSFGGDNQRFSCDDDGTISPIGNTDVVWGFVAGELVLVRRDDAPVVVTVDDRVRAAMSVDGPSTLVDDQTLASPADGYLLELESHPGLALTAEPGASDSAPPRLAVASVNRASRFCIGAAEIRPTGNGLWVGLGES